MNKMLCIILFLLIVFAGCKPPFAPTTSPVITPAPSILATPASLARPTNTPYPTRVPVVIVPGNLLIDPSLEGPYHSDGIHPEVNTSFAWRAWYSCQGDQATCVPPCKPGIPGCYLPCPADCVKPSGNCSTDYGCYWQRQEFNPFNFDKAPYRIHSGEMSQVIFSYGRMALGGIQQTVAITPGTWLKFSAWIQAWQCLEYGVACDWGRRTDYPSDMHLRIGIDPTGGIEPTSANIIWSPEQEAFDRWVEFSVTAQAQANRVTVFTQGGPTFDWARKNNDYYIDSTSLVLVASPTTPTETPTPTITPTSAPPTITPMPGPPTTTPLPTCQLSITQRVYVLLPPNSTLAWYEAALPVVAARGWSMGTSAVDACVNSCGGRITLAVNVQFRGCNLAKACVPHCGNSAYVPLYAETPEYLAELLARYPEWLREAKSFGMCLPIVVRQ